MAQDITLTEEDIRKFAQRGGMTLADSYNFWLFYSGAADLVSDGGGDPSSAIVSEVPVADSETQVVALALPAGSIETGDSYHIIAYATQAGTNAATPTIRVRIGPTTLTGNIAATLTGSSGVGGFSSQFTGLVTVRSDGGAGTILGGLTHTKSDGGGYDFTARNVLTATVAVDTTIANIIELTVNSGNAAVTYNFQVAIIKKA